MLRNEKLKRESRIDHDVAHSGALILKNNKHKSTGKYIFKTDYN
jgi:hypothetical protein